MHDSVSDRPFDLITLGRVSMDLFSENIGAPFVDIEGFETSVGGSPTNIAIGSSRLGLKVAALTAVGEDKVGDFVIDYLRREGVTTDFIPVKRGTETGLAVLGIQPPDRFPLVFYRENAADIHLTIDDVQAAPISGTRAVLLSGNGLSRGTCRDATHFAAEEAQRSGSTVFMDLDLRTDQWSHPRAYGIGIRSIMHRLDVVIGTEEEFFAAFDSVPDSIMAGNQLSSDQQKHLDGLLRSVFDESKSIRTLVVKRGARGVSIMNRDETTIDVAGFSVEILNTVGAGDAFASGLICGYLKGWDWYRAARLANACGALVVTRHGCSKAMPYYDEILKFIENNGGF